MFERRFLGLFFSLYLLTLFGCATVPYDSATTPKIPQGMPGIYHRVERGQTLWRISRIYNVDMDEIASINRILDTTSIETGRLIFIPNQKKQVFVPVGSSSDDFVWPVKGRVISGFGQTFNNMVNQGINIQPSGNSDVVASQGGRVVFYADNLGSFGKTFIIEHGEGFSTVYARNSQVFIKPGDSVQKGVLVAKVGSAGRDRNQYLHFEIRKGHISKNPVFYLP